MNEEIRKLEEQLLIVKTKLKKLHREEEAEQQEKALSFFHVGHCWVESYPDGELYSKIISITNDDYYEVLSVEFYNQSKNDFEIILRSYYRTDFLMSFYPSSCVEVTNIVFDKAIRSATSRIEEDFLDT